MLKSYFTVYEFDTKFNNNRIKNLCFYAENIVQQMLSATIHDMRSRFDDVK